MNRRRVAVNAAATLAVVGALTLPGVLHHGGHASEDPDRLHCYAHHGVLRQPDQYGVYLKRSAAYQPTKPLPDDPGVRFWKWMTPAQFAAIPEAKLPRVAWIECR